MCSSPVRHSRPSCEGRAFDLHVLGTPPAFILSQDQTRHPKCMSNLDNTRLKFIVNELSPIDRLITVLHLFLTTLQLFRYSRCCSTSSRLFSCLRTQVEYYHCVCVQIGRA